MRRRSLVILMMLGWLASSAPILARGQDHTNPDAVKKELADALGQLKAAQDRKNELANENEKLKAQIAIMQKQLDELQQRAANWSEETYAIRAREAAWNAFLLFDANLKARWEMFLETPSPELRRDIAKWMLATPATAPTTSPATAPATQK